jgi:dephospho-CoA kinase
MIVIGLTGGIGAGKSTASSYLKELGAAVWDADRVAREVVENGREGYNAILREFGAEYFDTDGNLLREKLGQRVFNNTEERKKLESLLHPAIIGDMLRWLDQQRNAGTLVAVIDAPLLFESGADQYVNEAWLLSCGTQEQINRLMQRGLDKKSAVKRLEAQMSDRERRRRADRVITTGGPVEETRKQLKALFEQALSGEI